MPRCCARLWTWLPAGSCLKHRAGSRSTMLPKLPAQAWITPPRAGSPTRRPIWMWGWISLFERTDDGRGRTEKVDLMLRICRLLSCRAFSQSLRYRLRRLGIAPLRRVGAVTPGARTVEDVHAHLV